MKTYRIVYTCSKTGLHQYNAVLQAKSEKDAKSKFLNDYDNFCNGVHTIISIQEIVGA